MLINKHFLFFNKKKSYYFLSSISFEFFLILKMTIFEYLCFYNDDKAKFVNKEKSIFSLMDGIHEKISWQICDYLCTIF